jgi:hypothetical protein
MHGRAYQYFGKAALHSTSETCPRGLLRSCCVIRIEVQTKSHKTMVISVNNDIERVVCCTFDCLT